MEDYISLIQRLFASNFKKTFSIDYDIDVIQSAVVDCVEETLAEFLLEVLSNREKDETNAFMMEKLTEIIEEKRKKS